MNKSSYPSPEYLTKSARECRKLWHTTGYCFALLEKNTHTHTHTMLDNEERFYNEAACATQLRRSGRKADASRAREPRCHCIYAHRASYDVYKPNEPA